MYRPLSIPLWVDELIVDMEKMKIRPLTKEEMVVAQKRKREKKTARQNKGQSIPTVDLEDVPDGTMEMVPKLLVATPVTESPPPQQRSQMALASRPSYEEAQIFCPKPGEQCLFQHQQRLDTIWYYPAAL